MSWRTGRCSIAEECLQWNTLWCISATNIGWSSRPSALSGESSGVNKGLALDCKGQEPVKVQFCSCAWGKAEGSRGRETSGPLHRPRVGSARAGGVLLPPPAVVIQPFATTTSPEAAVPFTSCSACILHAYHPCARHACMPHRSRMCPFRMYATCIQWAHCMPTGVWHASSAPSIQHASRMRPACVRPGYCMHPV